MWELLICFMATVAFAIIFNTPSRLLWRIGLIGVLAWTIYSSIQDINVSFIAAAAVAAFSASLMSYGLSRHHRVPVTTFAIPGIIPLVPGGKAYETMLAFVEENYIEGLTQGAATLLHAGAIAGGVVFALSIFSIGRGVDQRYET
ncbi:threonine/serine exporter family protein [Salicibibacter cibarius]|uniref:Threonine/serine exporter family protein n=1 Tax=Salicibibacter cibarius TaxID=2743000 RepID=A0A7T6YZP9_9BACI|nr:threonine/serine exporter family protein [Salicibibacter cibarius]QQK74293.1 threonine/serine exporter family protein [Salicibibacter cibarius]